MAKNTKESTLEKSPYKKLEDSKIGHSELTAIISMKDSGRDLYLFLLDNSNKFLAHNGVAYINPIEIMLFLNVTRKTIYNGINSMIQANILRRCNVIGEYYYNFNFFPE
jgi:hypothetical protein